MITQLEVWEAWTPFILWLDEMDAPEDVFAAARRQRSRQMRLAGQWHSSSEVHDRVALYREQAELEA